MTQRDSSYPVPDEIKAFMLLHKIETIEELLTIPNDRLFNMEGVTMHMMVEIHKQRKQKGLPDQ